MNETNSLRTIESVSVVGKKDQKFRLGDWAGEEPWHVQANLHLEYWKIKFPSEYFSIETGNTQVDYQGPYTIYTTELCISNQAIKKRLLGTVRTVKAKVFHD